MPCSVRCPGKYSTSGPKCRIIPRSSQHIDPGVLLSVPDLELCPPRKRFRCPWPIVEYGLARSMDSGCVVLSSLVGRGNAC